MQRVAIVIATKDRKHILHQALWSLLRQNYKLWDLVLVDDSPQPFSLDAWEKDSLYGALLAEIRREHKVEVISSPKSGKVGAAFQAGYKHVLSLNWNVGLLLRADDDNFYEPDFLELLVSLMKDPKVGAVGGLSLQIGKDVPTIPVGDERYQQWGRVAGITTTPNLQMFRHETDTPFQVEFLHSIQLLRMSCVKLVGGFDTNLFTCFRDENHISWRIGLEGYKLLVHPRAIAWHIPTDSGGNRGTNTYVDDSRKFCLQIKTMRPGIHISLIHGIGDLIAATPAIAQLRQKYPNRNITIWHSHAKDIFEGNPNIDHICTNYWDGQRTYRIEESVYGWMAANRWTGSLANAYCRMFGLQEIDNPLPRLYGVEPAEGLGEYIVVTPNCNNKLFDLSATSLNKHWWPDRWYELVEWVKNELGLKVYQLSGGDDELFIPNVDEIIKPSLREAFSIIKGARCLVSIDTMAQHAAAALDTPAVVLFGKTPVNIYGYQSDKIINLSLDCPKNHPCQSGNIFQQDIFNCPLPDHPCMDHSVESVKEAIMMLLEVGDAVTA
jgi:ADP-heptose:LPS heptosyltransferase/GT2 family glycosyltransferase